MSSDFMRDLEALIRAHSSAQSPASEDRILRSISMMITEMTRAIVTELRGPDRPGTMIRYRPDIERGSRPGTMIRYRPDIGRDSRPGTMIRYRPDIGRESRSGAMIRYRPDIGRESRPGTMIRYRPDVERDSRPGTMIRYRPDWDREPGQGNEGIDPQRAATGFLEPMFRNLAERLGPEEAQKAISETLSNLGLTPPKPAARARRKPAAKKSTG